MQTTNTLDTLLGQGYLSSVTIDFGGLVGKDKHGSGALPVNINGSSVSLGKYGSIAPVPF
jgi:hypothetical protein